MFIELGMVNTDENLDQASAEFIENLAADYDVFVFVTDGDSSIQRSLELRTYTLDEAIASGFSIAVDDNPDAIAKVEDAGYSYKKGFWGERIYSNFDN